MKKRQTNIELLRIVSMALIIGHHFAVHGGFYFHTPQVTGNMLFLQFLNVGGKIGVNLFVLISGYFLITEQQLRREKVWKLWVQIFFYSVVIFAIACLTGLVDFSVLGLLGAVFPVVSKQWWFASAYFVVFLLSPWINRKLLGLTEKGYRRMLQVWGIFWFLLPVLTWLPERLRDVIWFLYLYAAAGYLRLHGREKGAACWFSWAAAAFVVTYGYAVVRLYAMAKSMPVYETTYFNMYEIQVFLTSLLLFRGFLEWRLPESDRIKTLASLSFGVYLIHDSNYLRYPLWQGLAKAATFADSPWMIPYALALAAAVYALCAGLEALRRRI